MVFWLKFYKDSYIFNFRLIYWVDTPNKRIEVANMDGTNIRVLAADKIVGPEGKLHTIVLLMKKINWTV